MQSLKTNATIINVSVTNNTFSPSTFNAMVGDMIVWTWNSGGIIHNVTSVSIPAGATSFASGNKTSGTFSYTITTAGNYSYSCTIHQATGMVGGFSVSPTSISGPPVDALTLIYPNPFKEKLTIKYYGIETIDVFNIVGDKVKTIELSTLENKVELDFINLPSGIYFYRTFKDGSVVETKKIIKTK
ncbi:MAG: hypothetical protein A3F72_17260 [Bacteroidetes bacterium RIFCSPLOWO2_12_FULL_35_15]|nr:MAG: hypothetical protein A3F72_17260 [Bacteroidetes bacterium RIFCSPLOWO2_12_FULL_35_15]